MAEVTSQADVSARVKIAPPDSAQEREADRIADRVMNGAAATSQGASPPPNTIHRQCAACSAGSVPCDDCSDPDEGTMLHRMPKGPPRGSGASLAAAAVASGGQPLPAPTRAYFEPRFRADLGRVRMHDNARAGAAANAINARAYAYGADIAFAPGEFAPDTTTGQRLIAHELAHVVTTRANQNGVIQRDINEDASRRNLERSEIMQLSTRALEQLVASLKAEAEALGPSGGAYEGIVDNLLLAEDVLNERFSTETEPPEPEPERDAPAPTEVSLQEDAKARRKAARRARRKAKTARMTGEQPPETLDELTFQFRLAKTGATVSPTDLPRSVKVIAGLSAWLYARQTPDMIDQFFSMTGYNKTAAATIMGAAWSAMNSLAEKLNRLAHGGRTDPVLDGVFTPAMRSLTAARPYLRKVLGVQTKDDTALMETTEKTGHFSGAAMAATPVIIAGGGLVVESGAALVLSARAGATAVAGEVPALLNVGRLALSNPQLAYSTLNGLIASNPVLYYGVLNSVLGAAWTVAEVGGPEKFVKKASTPQGAAELTAQILLGLSGLGLGAIPKGGGGPAPGKIPPPSAGAPSKVAQARIAPDAGPGGAKAANSANYGAAAPPARKVVGGAPVDAGATRPAPSQTGSSAANTGPSSTRASAGEPDAPVPSAGGARSSVGPGSAPVRSRTGGKIKSAADFEKATGERIVYERGAKTEFEMAYGDKGGKNNKAGARGELVEALRILRFGRAADGAHVVKLVVLKAPPGKKTPDFVAYYEGDPNGHRIEIRTLAGKNPATATQVERAIRAKAVGATFGRKPLQLTEPLSVSGKKISAGGTVVVNLPVGAEQGAIETAVQRMGPKVVPQAHTLQFNIPTTPKDGGPGTIADLATVVYQRNAAGRFERVE